jgi:hypothetical protein
VGTADPGDPEDPEDPTERARVPGSATEPSAQAFGDQEGPHLDALRVNAREHAMARRRAAEGDGVLVDGVVYDTSESGLIRFVVLLMFATRDPDYTASMQVHNVSVLTMTAFELYKVAIAIANHMQACALWEQGTLGAIDEADGAEAVAALEDTINEGVPTGDVATPTPPEGTAPPPAYGDATFEGVTCLSAMVNGGLSVTGDSALDGPLTVSSDAAVSGSFACSGGASAGSLDVGMGGLSK